MSRVAAFALPPVDFASACLLRTSVRSVIEAFGLNVRLVVLAHLRTLPAYTILLDKLHDGNPVNNDYYKTIFEHSGSE